MTTSDSLRDLLRQMPADRLPLFVADCAARVLDIFEIAFPNDPRLRMEIESARAKSIKPAHIAFDPLITFADDTTIVEKAIAGCNYAVVLASSRSSFVVGDGFAERAWQIEHARGYLAQPPEA